VKVVLFCGGLGLRMRDVAERLPKPMVPILGYRGQAIKEYFLNYNEALLSDFVLSHGGQQLQLLKSDMHNWKITFVDTGINSNDAEPLFLLR
jgi:glucose-1-phosphate cytidylyltransferase